MEEKYEEFLEHLPDTASDKTLLVLKGHLLVEQALRSYIYKRVENPKKLENQQLPFASLLVFASSLESDAAIDWIWTPIDKLNKLRNRLAHNLAPKKIDELEKEIIEHTKKNDGELSILINDKQTAHTPLALAIFQLYENLERAKTKEQKLRHSFSHSIRNSLLAPLLDIDKSFHQNQGPKPRKKWPKN